MSVHDAEPDDIYADANGKLWRIKSVYREPTVEAEEVEGTLNDPNVPKFPMGGAAGAAMQGLMGPTMNLRATIDKRVQRGFTGATMWFGWQRIFRREKAVQPALVE
jgi:hypothetical protein